MKKQLNILSFFAVVILILSLAVAGSVLGAGTKIVTLYSLEIRGYLVDSASVTKFVEDVNTGTLSGIEAENAWSALLREGKAKAAELKKGGVDARFLGKAKVKGEMVKILPKDDIFFKDPINGTVNKGYVKFDRLVVFKGGVVHTLPANEWIPMADIDALKSSPVTAVMNVNGLDTGGGDGGSGGGDGTGGSGGGGGGEGGD